MSYNGFRKVPVGSGFSITSEVVLFLVGRQEGSGN